MPAALPPPDEPERLAALMALRILDTERTEAFDVFPALARDLFSVPISAVSFIGKDRHWNKASSGLGAVTELPRDVSPCAHAILNPSEMLCVPDATKDPRFVDNPFVTGDFGLRFYAGAPILAASGHALGTLCVMDREPRDLGDSPIKPRKRPLPARVSRSLEIRQYRHKGVDP